MDETSTAVLFDAHPVLPLVAAAPLPDGPAPSDSSSSAPSAALPPSLVPLLQADLPALADEIVRAVETHVPPYADAPLAPTTATLRRVVTRALRHFVAGPDAKADAFYRAVGRAELRAGRSLDALHSACWLGARLAWRRWSELAGVAGFGGADVCGIADAVLAQVEAVAAQASAGHGAEADEQSGGRRAGRRLLDLLLADRPTPSEALSAAAADAGWPMPESAAVVVLRPRSQTGTAPMSRAANDALRAAWNRGDLPPDVLADACLLVIPGSAAMRGIPVPHGWLAVAGPVGPLRALHDSQECALRCLDLVNRGIVALPPEGVVLAAADHLGAAILLRDEALLTALIDRHLAPLRRLPPKDQMRVVETLLAWLSAGRRPTQAAILLGLHPQTVRYRMRRALTVFDAPALTEPDLWMALRGWQLLQTTPRRSRATSPR